MREVGLVTKLNNSSATIKVDKKDECSKCGMCLFPKNASSIEFEADNKLGAQVGDTVMFETETDGKLLGAILVFLVPLLIIGISAVLAYVVFQKEIMTLVFSLTFIIVWFIVLSFIDKRLKKTKKFKPTIVLIVKTNN